MSSIKSKILLLYDDLKTNFHFIVISIVLVVISIKHYYFVILLVIYFTMLFLKNKKILVISLIISLFYFSHYIIKEINYNKNIELPITGKVIGITKYETYNQLLIKDNNYKYIIKTKDSYLIGDIIAITGEQEEYKVHYPNQFDYTNYLHYQNIKGVINSTNIKLVDHKFTLSSIHYQIKDYIDNRFPSNESSYLNTLVIGNDDTLNSEDIDKIGISHLFVISGLHVSILVMIVNRILKLFKFNQNIINYITVILIGLYVCLTNFLISVIRVFISLVFKTFFKLDKLDLISLNFIVVVLVNPYIIFSLSFILSYLIAFFMMLYNIKITINVKNKTLNKIINYLVNTLLLTLLIQLLVLPFVISINPDFNLISILVNPIFILFVTYLYLPISFLTVLFPVILPIYSYITIIFEYLAKNSANIEFLCIPLGNINTLFKVLYYGVYYVLLISIETKKYKYSIIFIIFMIGWYHQGIFRFKDTIYFLDMPEGDSTVIITKHMKDVIVIDTAEKTKNNDFTKIIKNFGIKHIDYLIISHSDSDHIGGSFDLVKKVKVKNLILGIYDKNEVTNYVKRYCMNTYYLKSNDQIKTKRFHINVLSPMKDYQNINDNSLVFILTLNNTKFLFTGDISTKVEKDLIKTYQINVDYLKVAHHGSKTSTSNEFLSNIKYKYAVVMSGYYNPFGFPINEVMDRIPKYKQLRTDERQTIVLSYKKKKFVLKN